MPAAAPSVEFVFPNDQPVVALEAGNAFKVTHRGNSKLVYILVPNQYR